MFGDVYRGARVLVTGHTGFKGSWLATWLTLLGADVTGYSICIPSTPSNFEASRLAESVRHLVGDVRDLSALRAAFQVARPDYVFHLAAQSIVRTAYADPKTTFDINIGGTVNVLECLRASPGVRAGVIITSDKCYQNVEWPWGYRETDRLGGDDPYSASKAAAEAVCHAYAASYLGRDGLPPMATTRAGNVVGGGDWAVDRLVPDCVRAWTRGDTVVLRNPCATRPWQHVLEPLSGYLWLAARLTADPSLHGQAFNFGPSDLVSSSVEDVVRALTCRWEGARWRVEPANDGRESTLLKLAVEKAAHRLGWRPVLAFEETMDLTAEWYREHLRQPVSMRETSCRQIDLYCANARRMGLPWAGAAA